MAQTTSFIREHFPIEGLVALIDDYLCPRDATDYLIGKYGHWERSRICNPNTWRGVCAGGHEKMIELMISIHAEDISDGVNYACFGGHIPAVELLLSRSGPMHSGMVVNACRGGHVRMVEMLVERIDPSLVDIDACVRAACEGCSLEIAKLMIGFDTVHDWNGYIEAARNGGHPAIIELLRSKVESL